MVIHNVSRRHRRPVGPMAQILGNRYARVFIIMCIVCAFGLYYEFSVVSNLLRTSDLAILPPRRYSISVLLTNYRDSEGCASTLKSLFEMAENPSTLHVFLFDEIYVNGKHPKDTSCLELFCNVAANVCDVHWPRIQRKYRDANDHVGPSPARHMVEAMIPENFHHAALNQFYLSIETRVEFAAKWDTLVMTQWHLTNNVKAILSLAPPPVQSRDWPDDNSMERAILCTARITTDVTSMAVVDFNPPILVKDRGNYDHPRLISQYSEKFHFGLLSALDAAPSDQFLTFVWRGIEYYRASRWWTRGFDFYTPGGKPFVYMSYTTRELHPMEQRVRTWKGTVSQSKDTQDIAMVRATKAEKQSFMRMRRLLGLEHPNNAATVAMNQASDVGFTLGMSRSMEQWVRFSQIDPTADFEESTDKQFQNCFELYRVAVS